MLIGRERHCCLQRDQENKVADELERRAAVGLVLWGEGLADCGGVLETSTLFQEETCCQTVSLPIRTSGLRTTIAP
jgi:hypothetical protein